MAKQSPISGKIAVNEIAAATLGKWKPSPGSVYPLLKKLEQDGLLRREEAIAKAGRQLFYSITAKGLQELKKQRKEYMAKYSEYLNSLLPLVFQLDAGKELDGIARGLSKALAICKEHSLSYTS